MGSLRNFDPVYRLTQHLVITDIYDQCIISFWGMIWVSSDWETYLTQFHMHILDPVTDWEAEQGKITE